MQNQEFIQTIHECIDPDFEVEEHDDDVSMRINFAALCQKILSGRFLSPGYLEAEKYKIDTVSYNYDLCKYDISGEFVHKEGRFGTLFDDEQLLELIIQKTTSTLKTVYALVK